MATKTQVRVGLFFSLLSVIAICATAFWWFQWRFIQTTDNAYVESDITQIAAQLSARVERVHVEDNQSVKAGTVLISLESNDFAFQVGKIKSQIASLEVQLASIGTLRAQQVAQIAARMADLQASHADLGRNQLNLDRVSALRKKGYASEEQLTTLSANTKVAKATMQKAQATLDSQRLELSRLDEQQEQLEAQLMSAHNDLGLAELNLSRTRIIAPIDGIVGHRSARQGQYVRPGEILMSIVPHQAWIQANFKETQISNMRPGQKASLKFDAYPDMEITGIIESLFPATGSQFSLLPPDNATGNFTKVIQRLPVKIILPEDFPEKSMIRPGLSVIVRVDTRD